MCGSTFSLKTDKGEDGIPVNCRIADVNWDGGENV